MDEIICNSKQVSKSKIEKAVAEGAKTFEDIQKITGACTGHQCKEMNPSGICCSYEIFVLLKNNSPKYKMDADCGRGYS
jgi:bacterioferritin-associated ferredoxin